MESTVTANAMSLSLLARNVYGVCFTMRDSRELLRGEITSPINPKPGCRFAARCPYCKEECTKKTPELREILPGHQVACHLVEEINGL